MSQQRERVKPVGYRAAQRIENADQELEQIIDEARKLINQPNSVEERYLRLGKILDAAHEGQKQLRAIRTKSEE